MAKCVYICSRKKIPSSISTKISKVCKKLAPDNIIAKKPLVYLNNNIAYGVINPSDNLRTKRDSLLVGKIFGNQAKWHIPLAIFPDGNYVLFRNDSKNYEIVTDPAGVRTIWYYFDNNILISSTSQRAIIMYLGSFFFNKRVVPWMLSSGSIGPEFSWDKRIRRVKPYSSIILDKSMWRIYKKASVLKSKPLSLPLEKHKKLLTETIKKTIKNIKIDLSLWRLPLSGGYDSRTLLCLFSSNNPNNKKIQTITWGKKSSLRMKNSDAYIAQKYSKIIGVPNHFYQNDRCNESIDKVISRFILQGEGRVDRISAYMDGFSMWKNLYIKNIQGIIRGDQCFGWKKVKSAIEVRHSVGLHFCSDYSNFKRFLSNRLFSQKLPKIYNQKSAETLSMWRDRLFRECGIPIIWAALSDLKLSYLEIIFPYLSKNIINQTIKLPDFLRTNKLLFKIIAKELCPEYDFATQEANEALINCVKKKDFQNLLISELSSNDMNNIFPDKFLKNIIKKIKKTLNKQEKYDRIFFINTDRVLGKFKKFYKRFFNKETGSLTLDYHILAFRVVIIKKMYKILKDDMLSV